MADLIITPQQVIRASGEIFGGIAGEEILAGVPCYLDAVSKTLKIAEVTSIKAASVVKGISLHGAYPGQPLQLQASGVIDFGDDTGVEEGAIYFLSCNAGKIAPKGDVEAEHSYLSMLGFGRRFNKMDVKIDNTGILMP